jgi:predicted dehydrogenase
MKFTGNFEEMLADSRSRQSFSARAFLHTEQIVKAAKAKKHVFCEKPLSLTRAT